MTAVPSIDRRPAVDPMDRYMVRCRSTGMRLASFETLDLARTFAAQAGGRTQIWFGHPVWRNGVRVFDPEFVVTE